MAVKPIAIDLDKGPVRVEFGDAGYKKANEAFQKAGEVCAKDKPCEPEDIAIKWKAVAKDRKDPKGQPTSVFTAPKLLEGGENIVGARLADYNGDGVKDLIVGFSNSTNGPIDGFKIFLGEQQDVIFDVGLGRPNISLGVAGSIQLGNARIQEQNNLFIDASTKGVGIVVAVDSPIVSHVWNGEKTQWLGVRVAVTVSHLEHTDERKKYTSDDTQRFKDESFTRFALRAESGIAIYLETGPINWTAFLTGGVIISKNQFNQNGYEEGYSGPVAPRNQRFRAAPAITGGIQAGYRTLIPVVGNITPFVEVNLHNTVPVNKSTQANEPAVGLVVGVQY